MAVTLWGRVSWSPGEARPQVPCEGKSLLGWETYVGRVHTLGPHVPALPHLHPRPALSPSILSSKVGMLNKPRPRRRHTESWRQSSEPGAAAKAGLCLRCHREEAVWAKGLFTRGGGPFRRTWDLLTVTPCLCWDLSTSAGRKPGEPGPGSEASVGHSMPNKRQQSTLQTTCLFLSQKQSWTRGRFNLQ